MIVVPVIADQRDRLCSLLNEMNGDHQQANPNNELLPFGQFDTLHTARLMIIDAQIGDDIRAYGVQPHHWPASLALQGEIDGSRDDFLAELAIRAEDGLRQIFSYCEGFEQHDGSLLSFLQKHDQPSNASYVNWIGRTVIQVREEAALHRSLAAELSQLANHKRANNPRWLRQQLLNHVQLQQHNGKISLTELKPASWRYRFSNMLNLVGPLLLLLLLSPLLVLITPFVLWRLRTLEKSDPDINLRPGRDHIRSLSVIEDHDVTNQFNVFGDIKPGRFRYYLFKSLLAVLNYSARHIYNKGFLARIRTIHFAHWIFLNDGRSIYFGSVYDGSLDSYMNDFINKVAFGLNLTFSHCVGYPRTRFMLKGGAELDQEFKDILRRAQFPSAVWYHANPGLTAFDLARNSRIRNGVDSYPLSDATIKTWLSEI